MAAFLGGAAAVVEDVPTGGSRVPEADERNELADCCFCSAGGEWVGGWESRGAAREKWVKRVSLECTPGWFFVRLGSQRKLPQGTLQRPQVRLGRAALAFFVRVSASEKELATGKGFGRVALFPCISLGNKTKKLQFRFYMNICAAFAMANYFNSVCELEFGKSIVAFWNC